jgi:hypothetical protein
VGDEQVRCSSPTSDRRDLVGFQGLLKDPTEILREAVEAYAAGSQAPPVTLPEADRRYVVDHLVDVAAGSLRESPLMSEIIDDVRSRKKRLHTRMTEAKALAEKHLGDAVDMRELRKLTFAEDWEAASESWAERVSTWFDRADDCRRQGWQGLLAVRPVRGVVGATLSLLFSQVVEKSDPDAGDGYDLWHALLASTADVFITRDGRLAKRLSRIPMDDFRVVSSISPLLTL